MKTPEEILQNCIIEDKTVKLPNEKLDRALYVKVASALERIGGKWNRKAQGFTFDSDPTDLLEQIANGEKRNLKKEFQFFETPSNIAKLLVEYANLQKGDEILEPSAGRGAIVREINAKGFIPDVYELMPQNLDYLHHSDLKIELGGEDFLAVENSIMYNKIIANPPFSNNQDIDHFLKMYDLLVQGGRIVCIMSNSWVNGEQKKQIEFRDFLKENKAEIKDLPAGSFKESGTMVSAKIVILDKPINKMKETIINRPNPNNPKIIILPELRELIRPLSQKEFDQLEENIIAEGIRDMLILWKRGEEHILVDGHNRFEISKKHGLDFRFLEREFADIDAVKEWMITNQLGKRNLTENEISYLRGLQYRQAKQTHGGDRKTETSKAHNEPLNETGLDSFKNIKPNTTAEKLAEQHKVAPATIKRDEEYADAIDKISVNNPDLRYKILNKDINISKTELKEIAKLPEEKIKEVSEGLQNNKPLSDLLPKTKPMEQPLPEEAETKFAKFLKEVKTPKETEIERNIYNHLLKVGENTFTNLVKVFGATENILTKMINEKRLLSRRSTGMLDKIYRVNPANTTKQIPETPNFPEISEAAEVDWKDGYYKCKAEEYQTTIYIDCANENFQMVEEDSRNQRYKIIAPFKEEMPRFSNFTEITSAEYREVFQAALKYFGVHHQEAKPIIPEKDKFTEEDYKNKELQKEFFGLYAEMPVQFQKDYVAIPRNQYKYFRGFISFVCQKRKEEVEEVKKNYDDFQKQIEELQQKNRWCFAGYDRFKLFNAGFKIYRCESTRYEENPQYIIKEFSDIGSWKNKSKHKTKADWKRAIDELLKDDKSVCETYPD